MMMCPKTRVVTISILCTQDITEEKSKQKSVNNWFRYFELIGQKKYSGLNESVVAPSKNMDMKCKGLA